MDATQGNEEMTGLDTLISRVRELKGPDREADALVHHLTASGETFLTLDLDCQLQVFERGGQALTAPAYTASLDATASLIERELPGYSWGARKMINGLGFATITRTDSYHDWFHGCCSFCRTATAETPTLALLLAFLTAIKERDA